MAFASLFVLNTARLPACPPPTPPACGRGVSVAFGCWGVAAHWHDHVRSSQHSGHSRTEPGNLNPDCPDLRTGEGLLNGSYFGGSGQCPIRERECPLPIYGELTQLGASAIIALTH